MKNGHFHRKIAMREPTKMPLGQSPTKAPLPPEPTKSRVEAPPTKSPKEPTVAPATKAPAKAPDLPTSPERLRAASDAYLAGAGVYCALYSLAALLLALLLFEERDLA